MISLLTLRRRASMVVVQVRYVTRAVCKCEAQRSQAMTNHITSSRYGRHAHNVACSTPLELYLAPAIPSEGNEVRKAEAHLCQSLIRGTLNSKMPSFSRSIQNVGHNADTSMFAGICERLDLGRSTSKRKNPAAATGARHSQQGSGLCRGLVSKSAFAHE